MKIIIRFIINCAFLVLVTSFGQIHAQAITEATWATKANEYNTNAGQRYTFHFPPGGIITGFVWGTGVYTSDCTIAGAAVHAGIITTQRGGTVTIEMVPGQTSYEGSASNGVTSNNWGSFGSSFIFLNNNRVKEYLAADVIQGNWVSSASEYNGNIGQQYTFYFPKGIVTTGQIWGTDIYTTDCSIATAAVHSGVMTAENGGIVTIEILPGQKAYKGSFRNGVTSRDWMSYNFSFRFVRKRHRH